jgi:hypothetical protein
VKAGQMDSYQLQKTDNQDVCHRIQAIELKKKTKTIKIPKELKPQGNCLQR